MSEIGHNSGDEGFSQKKLKKYIERIEDGEEKKRYAATHVSGIYAEAKSEGFDCKVIRRVVKDRKMSEEDRREQSELLDLYKSAIGMLD